MPQVGMPLSPRSRARRLSTALDETIVDNSDQAIAAIALMSEKPHKSNPRVDGFALEIPPDTVFVGHLNTDMDSIASAIGAADLFDGVPAAASKLNSESKYALELWDFKTPVFFPDLEHDKSRVCLMDHNQESQIAPTLQLNSLVGVIDHHALQNGTVITDRPIYIDIRPWGSACTIVGHTYLRIRKPIPKKIAGLLLSGILSDTLNLRSPTTTEHDRLLVAVLAKISEVTNINKLAEEQFKAKSSELMHMSPYEVACGDQKKFTIKDNNDNDLTIGFGVVETTDPRAMKTRIDELMIEVASLKSEQMLDFSFLTIVDIVNLSSTLISIGRAETELAEAAWNRKVVRPAADMTEGEEDKMIGTMELENMVSRKKDFIPALTDAIAKGFQASKPALEKTESQKAVVVEDVYGVVSKEWSLEACCSVLVRRLKKGSMKRINSFAAMATPGGGWAKTISSNNLLSWSTPSDIIMEIDSPMALPTSLPPPGKGDGPPSGWKGGPIGSKAKADKKDMKRKLDLKDALPPSNFLLPLVVGVTVGALVATFVARRR